MGGSRYPIRLRRVIFLDSSVRPPSPALPHKGGGGNHGQFSGLAAIMPRGPKLSYRRRRQLFLILLGAPALIYVLAVAIWPLAQGVSYSFYRLQPAAAGQNRLHRPRQLSRLVGERRGARLASSPRRSSPSRRSRSNSSAALASRCCCGATACFSASALRCC